MKSKNNTLQHLGLIALVFAGLSTHSAQAAVKTWTGATSADWSTGTNWGGAIPATGDSLVFTSATGAGGVTLSDDLMTPATFDVAGITFNSGSGAYVINPATAGTNGFTLTGNVTNSSTSLQTINDNITTTASRTVTLTAAGGNVTLGGDISGTGGNFTIAGTGAATATVGTLTLSGNNSFTGGVNTGTAGIIRLTSNTAAGTGTITVGVGGGFNEAGRLEVIGGITVTNALALFGRQPNPTVGIQSISGNNALTGAITIGAGGSNNYIFQSDADTLSLGTSGVNWNSNTGRTLTFTGAGNISVLGNIVGSTNAVTKTGEGTLTLSGANTYTGGTTLSGGTLALTGSSSTSGVTINGGTNSTLLITAAGAAGSGAINASTGATTPIIRLHIDGGGTIAMGNSFFGNSGITTTIDVDNNGSGSNGVIQLNGAAGNYGNGTLNITGNHGYSLFIAGLKNNAGGVGTTVLNPTSANLSLGTYSSTTNFAKLLQLDGTSSGNSVTGVISNGTLGTVSLTKANTSTWTLSGANTYTGKTTVSAGTLQFAKQTSLYNNNTASWTAANINVASGATLALNVGGTGEFASSDLNTLLTNISVAGSATVGLQSGAKIALDTTNAGGSFTQGNAIANSTGANGGAISLTKLGTGTLVLDQTNTYTGATTVTAGTLSVSSLANGGSNSNIGASTNVAGNLTLNGGTLQYTGAAVSTDRLFSLQSSSTIDASGSGAVNFTSTGSMGFNSSTTAKTLTLTGTNTGSNTIAAVIGDNTGATGVTKSGAGTWVLSGANTYTGVTSVAGGKLLVNGSNSGGGAYNVGASGTLGGPGSVGPGTINVSGVLSPGASVETFSSGTVNFATGSTFAHELNSAVAAATGADLQVVSGDLNLTGLVNLTLADLAASPVAFTPGTIFSLINYSGSWNGGTFTFGGNALADDTTFTAGLNTWQIDYNAATGGSNFAGEYLGGTDSFVNLTAVPEPASMLLGGLGLLALLRRHRK